MPCWNGSMWVEINSAAQVEDKDWSQMPAADTQDAILFLSQVNLPANTHTQKKKGQYVKITFPYFCGVC